MGPVLRHPSRTSSSPLLHINININYVLLIMNLLLYLPYRLGVAWRWDVQLSCDTTGSPLIPVDRKHVGFFARGKYCVSKSIFVLCESLWCSSRCPVVVTPHTISQVIDVSKSLSGCRSKEVLLSFVIARRKVCGSVKTLVCERYATSGDCLLLRRDCSIHPVNGYL